MDDFSCFLEPLNKADIEDTVLENISLRKFWTQYVELGTSL